MALIRFDQVSKVFPNGYVGLDDVSFDVDPGTLNYIVGESGAGKTTLMRLLIREIDFTDGEIYFEDQALSEMPKRMIPFLRRQISVVFQDYKLLQDRTVSENIDLILEIIGVPSKERAQKIEEVLSLVDLEDKLRLFPVQLSGGELQRVALARALATTPRVLFADEPTGNLDPGTGRDIGELLKKITELGTTVLASTHDLYLLQDYPGRELHLSQGRLIKDTDVKKHRSKKKHVEEESSTTETAEQEAE